MDDVASMCSGSVTPSLNVGGRNRFVLLDLVSNIPLGPPSVTYIEGAWGNCRHSVR